MKRSIYGTGILIVIAYLAGIVIVAKWSRSISSTPDKKPSLVARAATIMKLPPQAVVIYVAEDEWQKGNGDVNFTLPNTDPPEKWMRMIWDMNSERPRSKSPEMSRQGDALSFNDSNTDQTWESLWQEQSGAYPNIVHTYHYSTTFDK